MLPFLPAETSFREVSNMVWVGMLPLQYASTQEYYTGFRLRDPSKPGPLPLVLGGVEESQRMALLAKRFYSPTF